MVGKTKVTMFSTFQHLSAFWRRLSTNFTVRFLNNLVKSSGFLWPSLPPTPSPLWSSPSSATPLYFLFTLNLTHHLSKKCRYKIDSDLFSVLTFRGRKGEWDLFLSLIPGPGLIFWYRDHGSHFDELTFIVLFMKIIFFHFLPSFDFYLSLKNKIRNKLYLESKFGRTIFWNNIGYERTQNLSIISKKNILKNFGVFTGSLGQSRFFGNETGVENCVIQISGSRSRPVADSPLRLKSLQMSFYIIGEKSIFSMSLQFQSVLFSSCIFWLRFSDTLHSK